MSTRAPSAVSTLLSCSHFAGPLDSKRIGQPTYVSTLLPRLVSVGYGGVSMAITRKCAASSHGSSEGGWDASKWRANDVLPLLLSPIIITTGAASPGPDPGRAGDRNRADSLRSTESVSYTHLT